ncbi:PREDICTED: histidine-containing phosphotransfer protein 4-like [Lupinus angustifolius]|uniref:histidine-containing phosphotransfer protein 4-like n=1 Tax=Lupinus angustifolius TaxID=3871 RepID=UPI00092F267D|nr:PREDICTED: histidine-containing phosphotransfer protein 4-like [Lupinus angustifolius]
METYDGLCNKIAMMRQSFLVEGYVVSSQFQLLEELQDEKSPNFLQDIFSLYFRDTIRQFGEIQKMIYEEADGEHKKDMLNRFIYRLKGSVLSIGALKTLYMVNSMLQCFEEGNTEGMIAAFEQVKVENENLRIKMEPYLELLGQVRSYEKTDSPESQTGSSVTVEIPKSPGEVEGQSPNFL